MNEPGKSLADLINQQFVLVCAIALVSSLAGYVHGLTKGKKHSLVALLAQLMASVLSGAMSYWVGSTFHLDIEYICVISSVAGFAGTRTIIFVEEFLKNWAAHHVEEKKSLLDIAKDTLSQQVNKKD